MNKICTSIEQSQKLIDLGIDINTADMRYGYIASYDFSDRMYEGGYDPIPYHKDFFIKNPMFSVEEYDSELYAWSLSALLGLMPTDDKKDEYYVDTESHSDYYTVSYRNCWDGCIHSEYSEESLLDAAFKMFCWLLENKKL